MHVRSAQGAAQCPASYEVPSCAHASRAGHRRVRGRALQLRSVFDQSLIPMVMVDNERRYREVNAAATAAGADQL